MRRFWSLVVALINLMLIPVSYAQTSSTVSVPNLIRYEGALHDAHAAATTPGTVGVTFAIYKQQEGGAPIWMETQNVTPDASGKYSLLLGNTTATGLPDDLFSAHEQRWLGVQVQSEPEQPRVMLVSVPYAFKAHEAETLGGKPASAFALAPQGSASGTASETSSSSSAPSYAGSSGPKPLISGHGESGYLAYWKNPVLLGDSLIYQSGGQTIGIGTDLPPYLLTVFGTTANSSPVVEAVNSGSGGWAILGSAPAKQGSGTGVVGTSAGDSGYGVYGSATSNTGSPTGVYGQSAGGGYGVYGAATAAQGPATGVYGSSASTIGYGVEGIAQADSGTATGVYGMTDSTTGNGVLGVASASTGGSTGVYGTTASDAGEGVVGVGVAQSAEGGKVTLRPVGVWGDTIVDTGVGVLATADFGIAFAGYNNAENISTAKFQNDENTDDAGNILATKGGHFGGICVIDVGGNLGCNGSKSAVVPVDGGTRKVALYAVEAPENWFEDIGSAQLSNGAAVVQLEPTFAQTVNSGMEYHVFLTPKGDCKGLYVTNEIADSFEVRELGGGKANIAFDYRIVARRKGYENVRLADRTKQFDRVNNEPRPAPGTVAAPRIPRVVASGAK